MTPKPVFFCEAQSLKLGPQLGLKRNFITLSSPQLQWPCVLAIQGKWQSDRQTDLSPGCLPCWTSIVIDKKRSVFFEKRFYCWIAQQLERIISQLLQGRWPVEKEDCRQGRATCPPPRQPGNQFWSSLGFCCNVVNIHHPTIPKRMLPRQVTRMPTMKRDLAPVWWIFDAATGVTLLRKFRMEGIWVPL